jgi:hypothetical protein
MTTAWGVVGHRGYATDLDGDELFGLTWPNQRSDRGPPRTIRQTNRPEFDSPDHPRSTERCTHTMGAIPRRSRRLGSSQPTHRALHRVLQIVPAHDQDQPPPTDTQRGTDEESVSPTRPHQTMTTGRPLTPRGRPQVQRDHTPARALSNMKIGGARRGAS